MSNSSKDFQLYIDDLKHNVYCRIQPSAIHGVGVFAIRKIPKGANIFANLLPPKEDDTEVDIPEELIFNNPDIADGVKRMVHDFFSVHEGKVELPSFGLNELNISFYLNHSDTPNVETTDYSTFFATRDIEVGEELFSNYKTYTEESLAYVKSS